MSLSPTASVRLATGALFGLFALAVAAIAFASDAHAPQWAFGAIFLCYLAGTFFARRFRVRALRAVALVGAEQG